MAKVNRRRVLGWSDEIRYDICYWNFCMSSWRFSFGQYCHLNVLSFLELLNVI
jgi:hypothetical protein